MTGPEHYKAAEKLLKMAASAGLEGAASLAAQAQGHCLLALTAATVDMGPGDRYPKDWAAVTQS